MTLISKNIIYYYSYYTESFCINCSNLMEVHAWIKSTLSCLCE